MPADASKKFRAGTEYEKAREKKANTNLPTMAVVGNGDGATFQVAARLGNFYWIRLVNDGNRLTQCYSMPTLAYGDMIYVARARDRRLSYYEFVQFIQSAGGGIVPPVPAHTILGPGHSDAAVDAVTQGSLIVGNATPAWDELVIGGARTILQVNAGGTDPAWTAFDWDLVNAAVGADMVHDHSAALEGGQNLRQIQELEFDDATILTIDVNGTITRTQVDHVVAANAGVVDDLDQIDGGVQGDFLIIQADTGDTITVRHNAGGAGDNIWLAGGADIVLNNDDSLALRFNGTWWCDLSGGAGAGGNTLDGAYDQGGAGVGRTITADTGAVRVIGDMESDAHAFIVTNTSGGAVALGDVGYIDEAGEFKTTATQYDEVAWCVVVEGGADTADIYVARRGRVTVELDANCAIGDFLYTSGTATQASVLGYVRPGLFAVALTANAAGPGGTCEALLLCHRTPMTLNNANYVFANTTCSDSDWRSTCNGAPVGAVVTYNVPLVSGSEDAIENPAASLGRMVLHNTTRGTSAYISAVNSGANTITVTAAADVAAWLNGDAISCRSQTAIGNPYGAGVEFFDIYMPGTVPALAVGMKVSLFITDSGAANQPGVFHSYSAYAASKIIGGRNPVVNIYYTDNDIMLDLINRRFCVMWDASGASTFTIYVSLRGALVAAP